MVLRYQIDMYKTDSPAITTIVELDYTIEGKYCPLTLPSHLIEGETYHLARNFAQLSDSLALSGYDNADCGYEALLYHDGVLFATNTPNLFSLDSPLTTLTYGDSSNNADVGVYPFTLRLQQTQYDTSRFNEILRFSYVEVLF